ncbi:MAG: sarcosine oxidase gamma subunit [Alphaproteobacteria bacterium]|jgi:sarcosine oxidase subunit gamma|nr:sarcosine oxidase gamma subunit [Alphaproteobacteria bacterium]
MSDLLTRAEPVPADAYAGRQVTIRPAPAMARFSLRARSATDVKAILGVDVPTTIGATANGVACLGPDEWMLRTADGAALPDAHGKLVAVTDISHRNIGLIVEGERAIEVLSAGCPLDLAGFAIGRATRTIFETVEIIVEREAADRFHVEVWRSFAPWLWTALTQVASE